MRYIFILGLLYVLLLAACAAASDQSLAPGEPAFFEEAVEAESFDASSPSIAATPAASSNVGGDFEGTNLQVGEAQERLIIRNGQMEIVVEDTEETAKAISRLAETKNGWVVNSDISQRNGAKEGSISIRIPAEEFDTTVDSIREMALEVNSESSSSQDVTEEFVDLQARVDNLEATAARVRNFLDQARNVEEALAVNRELSRLESEIESIKARMQFLSQSAAFSSLTIFIIPDELSQPLEVGGWRPEGVARSAIDALLGMMQGLGSLLIWGVIFCLPIVLLFGVPLFFIGRYGLSRYHRRQAKRESELEPSEPEEESPELGEAEAAEQGEGSE